MPVNTSQPRTMVSRASQPNEDQENLPGKNIAVIPSLSPPPSIRTSLQPLSTNIQKTHSQPEQPPPDPEAMKQKWRAIADAQLRHNSIVERIETALSEWKPTIHAGSMTGTAIQSAPPPALKSEQNPSGADATDPSSSATPSLDPEDAFVPDMYQQSAISAAEAGESFFLTGSAGTGKSYVLKRIIKLLRKKGREVAVTASTGCAAVAINGNTVHSATGIGLGMDSMQVLERRARSSRRMRELLNSIDVLVIDEISMIDSYLFDKIELVTTTARAVRKFTDKDTKWARKKRRLAKEQENLPFGGVQIIVCGDFFQLPPVAPSDYALQYTKEKYFAFEGAAWKKTIKKTVVLRVVHRQSDVNFVGLLNEARYGVVSRCSQDVLEACLIDASAEHLEIAPSGDPLVFTKLFSYRKQVDQENHTRLKKITKYPGVKYIARDIIDDKKLMNMTRGGAQALLDNVQGLDITELKERSRVLCVKNIDKDNGIVNGSAGYVVGFQLPIETQQISIDAWEKMSPKQKQEAYDTLAKKLGMKKQSLLDKDMQEKLKRTARDQTNGFYRMDGEHPDVIPVVRFDNGVEMAMLPQRWEVHNVKGEVMAWRSQIPLTLGWALSIHKSQGMSLPQVQTDLAKAFDFGQVYVAISRATSVQGLRLTSFDRNRVMAHEKVLDFYAKAEQVDSHKVEAHKAEVHKVEAHKAEVHKVEEHKVEPAKKEEDRAVDIDMFKSNR